MDAVISGWICPDTPTIEYNISGSTLRMNEKSTEALGDETIKYKVTVTSLFKGTFTTEVSRDNMVIEGLYPNTIYTVTVELICSENPELLGSPKTFTFITGNANQLTCAIADFGSVIQDCIIVDPGDDPNPPSTSCSLNSMSWNVISSLFIKDPANNGSTNYYFETVISLNNAHPDGTDVLMPGGIAAAIAAASCYPNISSVLDVAIVSGAYNLIGASATMGNDGNLTITGTYATNGASQLILKVSGLYTYA